MKLIAKLFRFLGFFFIASGVIKFLIGNSSPLHYSEPSPAIGVILIVVGVVLLAVGARKDEQAEKR